MVHRPPWADGFRRLDGELADVREVAPSDASVLCELLSDPAVTEHVSSPPRSIGAFQGFISWSCDERERGSGICFAIVPHGLESAVGIIQVRALEPSCFTAEWGFAIGAAFWATGVFMDAANSVARFAFETMNVHRLEARAVERNGRGNGVLHKLGAKAEGSLSRAFKRDEGYDTQLLWALTADDWRQRRLVNGRFSAATANARIATAIADVHGWLDTHQKQAAVAPPDGSTPYPFFLTRSGE
jgi:[ribosomal protein S5]-alanine N-acetyltransferase